ncbi:MAG: hypothetical protein R2764_23050 [Bacteroidales bacterium]
MEAVNSLEIDSMRISIQQFRASPANKLEILVSDYKFVELINEGENVTRKVTCRGYREVLHSFLM